MLLLGFFFEVWSLTETLVRLGWLAGELLESDCLCLSCSVTAIMNYHIQILHGFWEIELVLSPIELSISPASHFQMGVEAGHTGSLCLALLSLNSEIHLPLLGLKACTKFCNLLLLLNVILDVFPTDYISTPDYQNDNIIIITALIDSIYRTSTTRHYAKHAGGLSHFILIRLLGLLYISFSRQRN